MRQGTGILIKHKATYFTLQIQLNYSVFSTVTIVLGDSFTYSRYRDCQGPKLFKYHFDDLNVHQRFLQFFDATVMFVQQFST